MDITIRRYQSSDFEACRSLWAELTQRHRDIYEDPTIGGDDPGSGIELYLKNEHLYGPWVALGNEHVIGLAGILARGEEAEVEPIVVSSQYRSQGIGKILIEHVVQEAKKLGVRFLSVRPVARNIEAVSFFVDAGFNIVGHIDLFQDLSTSSEITWKPGITIHEKKLKY
jgi:GNAT superfamily N-acetyltransferase